jgi:outer membrane protein insertion porin family
VSRGFDLYKRKVDASSLAVGPYSSDSLGGGVKFGYPVSEQVSVDFGLNLESVELQVFNNSPFQYINFVRDFGTVYTYLSASIGVSRDTRDSLIVTTAGTYQRASAELAGGDLQYFRLGYQHQWYWPFIRTFTAHLLGDIGYAGGYADKPLPFFKNYFVGGPGTVRGFRSFSLGERDDLGNALGGGRKVVGSAELLFPMPGAEHDKSVRLAAFLDGGNVYTGRIDLGELRYATGIALFWSSPLGPLRLSFAHPLNAKSGDRKQGLQFTFGTGF